MRAALWRSSARDMRRANKRGVMYALLRAMAAITLRQ